MTRDGVRRESKDGKGKANFIRSVIPSAAPRKSEHNESERRGERDPDNASDLNAIPRRSTQITGVVVPLPRTVQLENSLMQYRLLKVTRVLHYAHISHVDCSTNAALRSRMTHL
jgi:hypothetical protein